MGFPNGWLDYDRVGKQVHGTRFIAFKVPLREGSNQGSQVPEEKQLYPKLLVSLIPNLGLVIDLTNTTKYYNPEEFLKLGVEYKKINVEGHVIPKYSCSIEFRDAVNNFLENNQNNDKLIGVHCTHGLNRTGFLMCRYMIEEMKMSPLDAIAAFEVGRGHKMERMNYIDKLMGLKSKGGNSDEQVHEALPSLAIDTENDKATQTNHGYWIDESSLPKHHRRPTSTTIEKSDPIQKQVSLAGCVNIQRRDLIPDGHGGYFVHITRKEIQRNDPHQRNTRNRGDINSRNAYHPNERHHRYLRSNTSPYQQRPLRNENPRFINSLPTSSNNLAEGLLRMQHSGRPNVRQPF